MFVEWAKQKSTYTQTFQLQVLEKSEPFHKKKEINFHPTSRNALVVGIEHFVPFKTFSFRLIMMLGGLNGQKAFRQTGFNFAHGW
jgi:hypothetical protein